MKRTLGRRPAAPLVVPASIRVPTNVYDPPIAPQPTVAPVASSFGTDDTESVSVLLNYEGQSSFEKVEVYKTRKAWSAIDVFVDPMGLEYQQGTEFAVLIYAAHVGGRSLVASGRIGRWVDGAGVITLESGARYVASGRGPATHWEVVLGIVDGSTTQVATVRVTVVARNTDTPPDECCSISTEVGAAVAVQGPAELLWLSATNVDAAAKMIRVWDTDTLPAATDKIVYEIGIPAGAIGESKYITFPGQYRFVRGVFARALTWPGLAVDNNVSLQLGYR